MSIRRFQIDPEAFWHTMVLASRPDRELTTECHVSLSRAKFLGAVYLHNRGLLEIVAESPEWGPDQEYEIFTFHVKEKVIEA